MKPRVLALYYTQSGQLRDILDSLTKEIKDIADIDFVPITPIKAFPWPWNAYAFFDAMPETVERIPIPINPLPEEIKNKNYDLIILGYQPWFLNPSQPITGFLKSEYAQVLKNKPVITVVGCRNMWLHAQEKIKEYLLTLKAELVGNIVLNDTNPNLISTLTVIRWSFSGKKEASGLLPAAGVQEIDIRNASRFGAPILKHIVENNFDNLQEDLLNLGSVYLKPGLILLEQRGIKNFRFWAKYIREKGGPGNPDRKGRIILFKRLLLTAIFILSPVSSLSAFIKLQMEKKSLLKDVEYFKGRMYEKGRI